MQSSEAAVLSNYLSTPRLQKGCQLTNTDLNITRAEMLCAPIWGRDTGPDTAGYSASGTVSLRVAQPVSCTPSTCNSGPASAGRSREICMLLLFGSSVSPPCWDVAGLSLCFHLPTAFQGSRADKVLAGLAPRNLRAERPVPRLSQRYCHRAAP